MTSTFPHRTFQRIVEITRGNAERFNGDGYPYGTDADGAWRMLPVNGYAAWEGGKWSHGNWFCGFWVGLLWLSYQISGDNFFRDAALIWGERMKFRQNDPNSHDIGYMFIPSFLKGYLVTGEEYWRRPALTAAHVLAGRFHDSAGIVQAWGSLDDERAQGTSTVDTMMNLPLLWWAAAETGDDSFRRIAETHARTSLSTYIREDDSTYHTARFAADGRLVARGTYQGVGETSCWSRGQSWAIAGFAEAYRHTGAADFLDAAERVSRYYFDHVPEDCVPYWDYTDPEIPNAPRDSAAAAIAGGGFQTLADLHPDARKREEYGKWARRILASLADHYFNVDPSFAQQGILLHACYSKPHNDGVNSSLITGDYFFVENLRRVCCREDDLASPLESFSS